MVELLECIIYLATCCFCYSFVLSLSSGFKSRSTIDDTKAISLQYLESNAVLLFSYIAVAFSTDLLFHNVILLLLFLTSLSIFYYTTFTIVSYWFRKRHFIVTYIEPTLQEIAVLFQRMKLDTFNFLVWLDEVWLVKNKTA